MTEIYAITPVPVNENLMCVNKYNCGLLPPTMTDSTNPESDDSGSFLANILKPGSSLHPTFLAILDGAFVFLFLTLLSILFLTANIHIFALMVIELGLWASVKWFVLKYNVYNITVLTPRNTTGSYMSCKRHQYKWREKSKIKRIYEASPSSLIAVLVPLLRPLRALLS